MVRSHMRERTWTRPAAAPGRPPPRAFLPAFFRMAEMVSGEAVMREDLGDFGGMEVEGEVAV